MHALHKPLVSVLLPFRNATERLRHAISSMLEQSMEDFELLLIDNGSTDGSRNVVESLANIDNRIRLLHELRVGIVPALNLGLALARGKYIARMDADDTSHPDRLALQVKYLDDNSTTDVVASQVEFVGGVSAVGLKNYVDWSNQLLTHEQMWLNRFVDAPLVHPSVMFRRHLIDVAGPYREGPFPEDFELWLRWMEKGVRFHKIKHSLIRWHDHPKRLTRTDIRYGTISFYRVKSVYLDHWLKLNNPFYPEIVVWGAGRKSRQRAALLEKQGCKITAYIDIKPDRTKTLPCIHFQKIAQPGSYFVVSYVANRGQGQKIREFLVSRGYREGKHFLLAA